MVLHNSDGAATGATDAAVANLHATEAVTYFKSSAHLPRLVGFMDPSIYQLDRLESSA